MCKHFRREIQEDGKDEASVRGISDGWRKLEVVDNFRKEKNYDRFVKT